MNHEKAENSFIFSYRKHNPAQFQKAGFQHKKYLPLAANVNKRTPKKRTHEENLKYKAEVAYVGNSMVAEAIQQRKLFVQNNPGNPEDAKK